MDRSDTVLIAIIVTTVILSVGSISICIILLVLKWNQLKRREIQRICVAQADTSQNDEQHAEPPPPYPAPPSPDNPRTDYPPPVYSQVDTGTPQVARRNDQNTGEDLNNNDQTSGENASDQTTLARPVTDDLTVSYSPPPPYTILPPRSLITREGISGVLVSGSRPTSERPYGTGSSMQLVTPAGIMFSVPNSRQASGRTIRGRGSADMSRRLLDRTSHRLDSLNNSRQSSAATRIVSSSLAQSQQVHETNVSSNRVTTTSIAGTDYLPL